MLMKKILLPEPIHRAGVELLQKENLEVIISPSADTETLVKIIDKDVFGIIVRTSELTGEVLKAGKGLNIVARQGIGFDNVDIATANELNIVVTNVPDANAYSVAEYVCAAMLLISRKFVVGDRYLREGRLLDKASSLPGMVKKFNLGGNDLRGKTLGILGLGKIGLQVAEIARFFEMKVLAFDPFVTKNVTGVTMVKNVKEVLTEADFITLHAPLTKDTKDMITREELSMMKSTAYIINSSRGGLVHEGDLAEALKEGLIAGAVMDVFSEEPPRLDNPLFNAPNLVLTPHIAGSTEEAMRRMAESAAQAVVSLTKGEKPLNIVNPEVWPRRNS